MSKLRTSLIRLASTLPKGSAERKALLAVLREADEADTGWATMLQTQKYVTEELAPADNYSKQVSLLKSLQKGDKVEITYYDSQRGGAVQTVRVVTWSWAELQAEHPGGFNRPVVLLAAKGVVPSGPKGGMISDYGTGDGVVWQPSMRTQVRGVENLRKV